MPVCPRSRGLSDRCSNIIAIVISDYSIEGCPDLVAFVVTSTIKVDISGGCIPPSSVFIDQQTDIEHVTIANGITKQCTRRIVPFFQGRENQLRTLTYGHTQWQGSIRRPSETCSSYHIFTVCTNHNHVSDIVGHVPECFTLTYGQQWQGSIRQPSETCSSYHIFTVCTNHNHVSDIVVHVPECFTLTYGQQWQGSIRQPSETCSSYHIFTVCTNHNHVSDIVGHVPECFTLTYGQQWQGSIRQPSETCSSYHIFTVCTNHNHVSDIVVDVPQCFTLTYGQQWQGSIRQPSETCSSYHIFTVCTNHNHVSDIVVDVPQCFTLTYGQQWQGSIRDSPQKPVVATISSQSSVLVISRTVDRDLRFRGPVNLDLMKLDRVLSANVLQKI
ncbi:hypothetical protein J6590_017369 [Homalodisca vitripennis]|nr:hypothetical protein J6590_017369 [Homalodisca vitripennis]